MSILSSFKMIYYFMQVSLHPPPLQVSVEGEPHEKAVELLKAAIASVKLVVRYESSCSATPGL